VANRSSTMAPGLGVLAVVGGLALLYALAPSTASTAPGGAGTVTTGEEATARRCGESGSERPTDRCAAPIWAPALRLSPASGPPGTRVRVSGAVPRGARCPFVRVTVARPAAGVAGVVAVLPARGRRFAGRYRVPAIELPTSSPRLSARQVVRAVCVPRRRSHTYISGQAEVTFAVRAA
jgi:hypothetical protein